MNRLCLAILASAIFHGSLFGIVLQRPEARPRVNVDPGKTSIAVKMKVQSAPETPPRPETKQTVEPKKRKTATPRPVETPEPKVPDLKQLPEEKPKRPQPTPPEPNRPEQTPQPTPAPRITQEPDPPQEQPLKPRVARTGARWIKKADYRTNPSPDYPPAARKRGEEGTVILRVRVNRQGEPIEVQVRTSSGHDRLDRAAVEAVSEWQFTPAEHSGVKVASTVLVPIRFQLN